MASINTISNRKRKQYPWLGIVAMVQPPRLVGYCICLM